MMQFLTLTCPGNVEVRLNGTGLVFLTSPRLTAELNAVLALQWLQSGGSRYLTMSTYCRVTSALARTCLFLLLQLPSSSMCFSVDLFFFFFFCHTFRLVCGSLSVDGNAYVYTCVDLGDTITIQVKAIQYINGNAVAILPNVYW